jgi:hypothetical protein
MEEQTHLVSFTMLGNVVTVEEQFHIDIIKNELLQRYATINFQRCMREEVPPREGARLTRIVPKIEAILVHQQERNVFQRINQAGKIEEIITQNQHQ